MAEEVAEEAGAETALSLAVSVQVVGEVRSSAVADSGRDRSWALLRQSPKEWEGMYLGYQIPERAVQLLQHYSYLRFHSCSQHSD